MRLAAFASIIALIAALNPLSVTAGEQVDGQAKPSDALTEVKIRGEDFLLRLDTPASEGSGRSLAKIMAAFPRELVAEPSAEMSGDDILGEVEEYAWAARLQYQDALSAEVNSEVSKEASADKEKIEQKLVETLRQGNGGRQFPRSQSLYDKQLALGLVVKGLRRSLEYPEQPPNGPSSPYRRLRPTPRANGTLAK